MQIKKHIGKLLSSDHRCVVVMMQLPDDKSKALVVDADALPLLYEQMITDVLSSREGQAERDLANVMTRRTVPETGRTVLEEFHVRGFLFAESIENIVMLPFPNTPYKLTDLLAQMGEEVPAEIVTNTGEKFNPVVNNMNVDTAEATTRIAQNLLVEAELLEQEAKKKRDKAYREAPHLRPEEPKKPTKKKDDAKS